MRPFEGEKGVVIQDKLVEDTPLPLNSLNDDELEEFKFGIVLHRLCTQSDPIVRPTASQLVEMIRRRALSKI